MGGSWRPPTAGCHRSWCRRCAIPTQHHSIASRWSKGWAVAGESHERVYDVACADGRQPDPLLHRCAKINVDADDCNTTSGQGAATLAKSWHDPDFEPNQRAFYYARVLEVPTCRYTTYDARTSGASLPEGVAPTIQERAWSSPVPYAASTRLNARRADVNALLITQGKLTHDCLLYSAPSKSAIAKPFANMSRVCCAPSAPSKAGC